MAQAILWSQEGFSCDCESAYRLYERLLSYNNKKAWAYVLTDVNASICDHGFTIFQYAVQVKHPLRQPRLEFITRLIMNGANPRVTDDMGNTVLHQAITKSLPRIMTPSMLRQLDKSLYLPDYASKERQDYINFLCPFIDINSRNHNGETALMLAISSYDHTSAMTLIRRPGINLKARDIYGHTALDKARLALLATPDINRPNIEAMIDALSA